LRGVTTIIIHGAKRRGNPQYGKTIMQSTKKLYLYQQIRSNHQFVVKLRIDIFVL